MAAFPFRSISSMINSCFMVGEHVNVLKKQSCENSEMTNDVHNRQDKGLFLTLCYCYRSDDLFGLFYFPVLKKYGQN